MRIPLAQPDLSELEEEYVLDAIKSTWISSTGKYVDRFERHFAELCGTTASIGVCNGTVALHLALLSLDVRPGDEVLVPSLTYVATANAVRYVGAEPVFVDVDPRTWCIDPNLLEEKITRRTKGIIAVHIYGHPADMDAINFIAGVHGLWVVEDAAEAHAARYKDRQTGSLSRIACFSFYGNKIFTSGEGGAITLSDPNLELRVRTLRGQGVDPHRRYFFPVTGYNFRLTNVACAILCAQMERRDKLLEKRRHIFSVYTKLLKDLPGITLQPVAEWAQPAPWLYSVLIDGETFGKTRDQIIQHLAEKDIETRPFFIPLHTLPPFREESQRRGEALPITQSIASTGINLPTYTNMSDSDIEEVVTEIESLQSK
jgi:perosamine synthetase